jgi:predicted secreted protein
MRIDMRLSVSLACIALVAFVESASAQTVLDIAPVSQPVVTITATATSSVANDRMHAFLRAEAEDTDATKAASQVNARMARALSRARGVAGVEAATAGYSSYQIMEQNKPVRWRVAQALSLESSDFAALSDLVSKLQGTDGLLLSNLNFTVSEKTRRAAEDALTQEAIGNWQQRAQAAAKGFGASGWRAGRVTIQGNDYGRPPQPMYRASVAADRAAPVAVEGGMSDIAVTVSGEAILEPRK